MTNVLDAPAEAVTGAAAGLTTHLIVGCLHSAQSALNKVLNVIKADKAAVEAALKSDKVKGAKASDDAPAGYLSQYMEAETIDAQVSIAEGIIVKSRVDVVIEGINLVSSHSYNVDWRNLLKAAAAVDPGKSEYDISAELLKEYLIAEVIAYLSAEAERTEAGVVS